MRLHGTSRINEAGRLEIGGCDAVELAREFGTPLYVFDETLVRENCRAYREGLAAHYPRSRVLYASKAFMAAAMARLVEEEGLYLDVVSGGELYTALRAGFAMDRVYFHGNNKTPDEIGLALDARVGRFIVDNSCELELLNDLARRRKMKAKILLRVTPGIEAHTHEYVKTGQIDSKFGVAIETGQAMAAVQHALKLRHIEFKGIHCHIGSQIFDFDPFEGAANVMMDFARRIYEETDVTIEELNLGGGLGVYYTSADDPPSIRELAAHLAGAVRRAAEAAGRPLPILLIEPGRSIVGEAGTTLYTVGSIKEIPGIRTYAAVDGGMGDNPRPALYGSKYEALVANKATLEPARTFAIAGKCCESGDMLIREIALPGLEPGDILAVLTTGAYNYSMASNYNRITRPAVVFVVGGIAELVVRRESYEDIISLDVIPERMRQRKAANLG